MQPELNALRMPQTYTHRTDSGLNIFSNMYGKNCVAHLAAKKVSYRDVKENELYNMCTPSPTAIHVSIPERIDSKP